MTAGNHSSDFIGPYSVIRRIGVGGTSEVYAVAEPGHADGTALKWAGPEPHHGHSLAREVEAVARLNHPSMIRLFDFGEHEGRPWFTMDRVSGVSLVARVRLFGAPGDAKRTRESARLICLVASALEYVHSRGVLHRDLKSDNVLVLPDGRIKLVDFGAASCKDSMVESVDNEAFVGTFAYASPEQLACAPLEERSDVYSLGVLAYRLFSGKMPFQSEDPLELARLHVGTTAEPLSEVVAGFPPEVDRVVAAMMAKRPVGRPGAREVAHALGLFLDANGANHKTRIELIPDLVAPLEQRLRKAIAQWRAVSSSRPFVIVGSDLAGRSAFVRALGDALAAQGEGYLSPLASAVTEAPSEWLAQNNISADRRRLVVMDTLSASFVAVRDIWIPAIRDSLTASPPASWIVGVGKDDGPALRAMENAFGRDCLWYVQPYAVDEVAALMGQLSQRSIPLAAAEAVLEASGGWAEAVACAAREWLTWDRSGVTEERVPEVGEYTELWKFREHSGGQETPRSLATIERRVLEAVTLLGPSAARVRVSAVLSLDIPTLDAVCTPLFFNGRLSVSDEDILYIPDPRLRRQLMNRFNPARRHALSIGALKTSPKLNLAAEAVGDFGAAVERIMDWGHHGVLECLDGNAADWLAPVASGLGLNAQILLETAAFVRGAPARRHVRDIGLGEGPTISLFRAYQAQALGDLAEAGAAIERARQGCQEATELGLASAIAVTSAQFALRSGRSIAISEQFETAGRLAELSGVGAILAHAEAASASFLLSRGEIGEAERLASRALERTDQDGKLCHHGSAWSVWSQAVCAQGRISEARAALEGALLIARRGANLHRQAQVLLALSRCELALHRLGSAEWRVEEVESLLSVADPFALRGEVAVTRGRLLVASGRFDEAVLHITSCLDDGSGGTRGIVDAQLRAVLAEAHAGRGERAQASTLFQRALDALTAAGDRFAAAEVAVGRVRALADAEDPDMTWREVGDALESRGGLLFALEYRIAKGRYLLRRGDESGVKKAFREGAARINRWASVLDASDQAALRFHPWSRAIRRALHSI